MIFHRSECTNTVHKVLLPLLKNYRIITFTGPLGAGKTTLIKELLRQSGVTTTVTSPTFGYFNTYHNQHGKTFYHFDLYRISSVNEFINAGFDEYLNQEDAIVFIEWPDVIDSLLKDRELKKFVCRISLALDLTDSEQRILHISQQSV
jgi:tRNA threonylcarbamoyladenosine biosynthesis protein TsaE